MKLAIITHCAKCPHYQATHTTKRGFCGQTNEQVRDSFARIPHWCPLPDAKEEHAK